MEEEVTTFLNTTKEFVPNTTTAENRTLFSQYPESLLDAGAAICILFTIIGVSGNFITILALAKCQRMRNATTAFVINLCCADLLFCSFSVPLSAVMFLERDWNYGDTLCKLFALFRYLNGAVSLFSVIAITINRYIRIVHPKHYPAIYKPRIVVFMVVILWVTAFGLLSFPLFEFWGKLGYDAKVGTCSILRLNGKSPKAFIYTAAFGLPSVVFIFCYFRIYCTVRKASRKVRLADCPTMVQPRRRFSGFRFSNYRWEGRDTPKTKRDSKEVKILKVMLVIFITYILCYFPVSFVKIFRREDDLPVLNILGYLLVYFSCCVNPLIYVAMSAEYRQAYKQVLACRSTNPKF